MAGAATGETIGVHTPLGNALKITTFSGHEGISQLFEFQLGLVAPNAAHVPFETLIGQPVTVKIGSRYFSGIVQRFGEGGRGAHLTTYAATLVPSLWLLTRRQTSRIFQNVSVPDILTQVISGFPVDFRVAGTYKPRNYCVQYRETDFDFASRLMEEEGIFYFFEHTSNGHTLVVTDSSNGFAPLAAPVSYDPTGAARNDAGVIYAWEKDQELRSGLVTLRDQAFQLPGDTLEVHAQVQETVLAGTVTHHLHVAGNDGYEIYDYPGGYAKRIDDGVLADYVAEGTRTAGIRMQEEALPSLQVNGSSNAERLIPGYRFTLHGHFDANGGWVITSVDHAARAKSPNGPVTYTNTFSCIPAGLPFRPPRATPKPTIHGTQTAVVTGPPGQQIYTDKYGRVKVQFFWDRQGKKDEKSSCWIRVGHPALPPGVQASIPEINDEVIVAFEEGDPDRPIIIGAVYYTQAPPP
jgi:type VI secretion system secreted protein VgrG